MRPILIIQNDEHEGAGLLSSVLAQRGLEQDTVLGYSARYEFLAPEPYSGLVLLGGAQGAYAIDKYPYLQREMDLCLSFIEAGKPIAGFCLGAQILACAVGGEVVPNDQKEIGWFDLTLSDLAASDPLLRGSPSPLLAYHFHGDIIKHVPGGINLARSAMTAWQLFRYGSNVYGFQYHAEADQHLIEVMCRNNSAYMAANGVDAETIIEQSRTNLPDYERHCDRILSRWVDLCCAAVGPPSVGAAIGADSANPRP
jgi:GMP synthase (glutamine-hydrolysing)